MSSIRKALVGAAVSARYHLAAGDKWARAAVICGTLARAEWDASSASVLEAERAARAPSLGAGLSSEEWFDALWEEIDR